MTTRPLKTVSAYDVVIAGGGPVGTTLGYALAKAGLMVAILDIGDPSTLFNTERDGRTSALSQGSCNILKALDLWKHLQDAAEPILDIRISDQGIPWSLNYPHDLVGTQPMGHIIENTLLRRTLYEQTAALANVAWYAPNALLSLEQTPRAVRLTLKSGKTLAAKLCVGADGRKSQVREIAHIPITRRAYPQTAIVCTVAHEYPHQGLAFEHFMPSGPLAFLPMQGNRSSVVWSEQTTDAALRMQLNDSDFSLILQRKFGDHLGEITLLSKRWTYPLEVLMAHRFWDQRLVLAGDSAHVIHPIAGQGLNLGLRDVAALAEVIVEAHRLGLDSGSPTVLERYQRWRRFDMLSLAGVTDGLNRLFSASFPPVRWLRAVGLGAIEHTPFAKKALMRRAMGIAGRLPKLAEGRGL